MFPNLRWIFFYPHIGLTSWTPNLSFHGCLRARECFLLVRQRTQICDCACQSATQVAALSSLWPKTTRTSNFPQICLSRGRTKVLHQPKQQSPAGETSPTQSECVIEQHCCSIGSCSGSIRRCPHACLPCLLSNLTLLCVISFVYVTVFTHFRQYPFYEMLEAVSPCCKHQTKVQ